jgi:hypothetical protein
MKKSPAWLYDFRKNVYSQTGEDGVIEKILEILPEKDSWCVEFGAWDGKYLSNTYNLIAHKNYKAVFIEADKTKFVTLKSNFASNKNVFPVNQFVGFESNDNLDHILEKTPIPENFDFLSIDIDGNDYYAWQAMTRYKPKLVVIEFNPTIPTEVNFVQEKNIHTSQGCSLTALVELGKEKNYELVCVTTHNAFFVRKEYFPLFEIDDNSAYTLRKELGSITYIFSGYDGQVFLRGQQVLLWHNIPLRETKVQHLPKILRKFPDNYSTFQKVFFNVFCKYKQISLSLRKGLIGLIRLVIK